MRSCGIGRSCSPKATRSRSKAVGWIPGALVALALSGAIFAEGAAAATLPASFQDSFVANADRPTALAFTPDGRLLIGEEAGVVRVYQGGSTVSALDISASVCSDVERGLMALAVDPAFSSNHFIYVYYTFKKFPGCDYNAPTSPVNRVSRFVLSDSNVVDPLSEQVLVDNIPAPEGYHIGADLQFGKDGFLYISTGDGGCDYAGDSGCLAENDAARDEHVLLGKILRITRDGAIPAGNPFQGTDSARCNLTGRTDPGNKCRETFAWGLRNPFRMGFDPNAAGTRFFINDVGDITWEEIDLGQSGADYGWNVREGHCATGSQTNCGPPPAGMTNPIHDYSHDTGCTALTGAAFVPSFAWPRDYDRAYLYADTVCGKIFRLTPAAGGGFTESEFASGFGSYSIVAMVFGPHGAGKALYYTNWAGPTHQVRRIAYTGPGRGVYPRPERASSLTTSLVPSFRPTLSSTQCSARGGTASGHGAPLSFTSCNPPGYLPGTMAWLGPQATASAELTALPGNLSTPADEADISFSVSATDTRARAGGADYNPSAGGPDLTLVQKLRISDTYNGPSSTDPATVADFDFSVPVACTTTAGPQGSTCTVDTTADALTPGTVREGEDSVVQVFRIRLNDSGQNGIRGDADDRAFAHGGLYVP